MYKILILLVLFYYSSCIGDCFTVVNPKEADDCLSQEAGEIEKTCCFLEQEKEDIRICYELPKDIEDMDKYISENYPAYKTYTITCEANYLKATLLLISALILL